MSEFCGDLTCAGRIQVFLMLPNDAQISEPCPQCVAALADLLHVDHAVTMREIHRAVTVGQL